MSEQKQMKRVIDTNILAFRPGEIREYFTTKPDADKYYAVMLVETPTFPGDNHIESRNLALVCAQEYATIEGVAGPDTSLWGWVHLEASSKEAIGEDMEEIEAHIGEWYFMTVDYKKNNR